MTCPVRSQQSVSLDPALDELQAGAAQPSGSSWQVEVVKNKPAATQIAVIETPRGARMTIHLTQAVKLEASTVSNPDRVIIDLPAVDFRVDPALGQKGKGVITAYRFGVFGPRHSRVVIDTAGPVHVERAAVLPASGGHQGAQAVIELVREDRGAAAARRRQSPRATMAEARSVAADHEEEAAPAVAKSRPVVVIDPGHGGIDPGTVAPGGFLEKDVVLAVCRQLRSLLSATGRYTVIMTRVSDTHVSLDQRLEISRKRAADLFISIHADAVPEENQAQSVRGGSIYTLSEEASDEQARRLAERENSADIAAGLEATPADERGEVRNILIDLLRRETADLSAHVRGLLVNELRNRIVLSRDAQRSAAFKVLKQTHTPSVLIELGYMSNADDRKLLRSPEWHKQVAESIAAAINTYFSTRTAGSAFKP